MKRLNKLIGLLALAGLAAAAHFSGAAGLAMQKISERVHAAKAATPAKSDAALAPAVTVTTIEKKEFVETVLVTGSFVPREEILVAPEIEGLRVLELKVGEGDRVTKGQVLAILVAETLDAQIAENDASLARAAAAISRAKSVIAESEARLDEAAASLQRARPLKKSGWIADSTFDQREASARTAKALLAAARDGLKLAEAEQAQVEAQRRQLMWRRNNVEVKSPADGLVSRETARIGGMTVGSGEPMFRIIARGEIELAAEVPETRLAKLAMGQHARIDGAGAGTVDGKVRMISPEVDKATRLGRVRIFIGDNPALRIGAFARGTIETARANSLAVAQSAVLYGDDGAIVQVVADGKITARRIETGMSAGDLVEVRSGLAEGDIVVAKAGTFLRDGDAVRPIQPEAKLSESRDGVKQ